MAPASQSSPRPFRFSNLGIAASVILHLGAFAALNRIPTSAAPAMLSSVVEFEVPPPEPPRPEPEKEPEPAPEPELKPEPLPIKPAALVNTPEPTSDPEPTDASEAPDPSPEPAPVADLTGLTLTNDNGSGSWGSRVGNGQAIERPIRAGSGRGARKPAPPAPPTPSAAPRPSGPAVVAVGDLSSRPVAPKLDGILEQHYPEAARQQGKSGTAIVRLRIDPDGRVRRANIVSESEKGFGRACHATVVGSQWSPPRDHDGRAVATFVSYTCRFRSTR